VADTLPSDPHSKEYYDAQIKLYLDISGKDCYTLENESSDFDFQTLKTNLTLLHKSPTTVGDQLIAQGF
jgi:hypothetical protein